MSMQSKLKARGIFMMVTFFIALAVIFSPVFPGKSGKINGLDYADNLFNMVSKGSSNFIAKEIKGAEKLTGTMMDVKVKLADEKVATSVAKVFEVSGAKVAVSGAELVIKGDVGQILKSSLSDADLMFKNNGKPIADKYGLTEQEVVFSWWSAFDRISKDYTKAEKYVEAKPFANAQKKALEPAYNYYGIDSLNWKDSIGMVMIAICFYVFYTLWYGFGLMYLFEGLGLKIGH
jgi:hypothetical protein